jgi:hypothetical protein
MWKQNQQQSKQQDRGGYRLPRTVLSSPAHHSSTIRDQTCLGDRTCMPVPQECRKTSCFQLEVEAHLRCECSRRDVVSAAER